MYVCVYVYIFLSFKYIHLDPSHIFQGHLREATENGDWALGFFAA